MRQRPVMHGCCKFLPMHWPDCGLQERALQCVKGFWDSHSLLHLMPPPLRQQHLAGVHLPLHRGLEPD